MKSFSQLTEDIEARRQQLVSRVRLCHRYLRQVMKEIAVSDRRLRDQLLQVGVQVQGISLSKLRACKRKQTIERFQSFRWNYGIEAR